MKDRHRTAALVSAALARGLERVRALGRGVSRVSRGGAGGVQSIGRSLGAGETRREGRREGKREESWRALLDAIPDPALVLDASGLVVRHNIRVTTLFPTIRRGQALTTVLRSPALVAALDEALTRREPIVVEIQERVPVERWLAATLSPLAFETRTRAQPELLVTFRDLTEHSRLAEMRADFVANASHELRTPLAALSGFVDTLQGAARDDPAARERFLGLMAGEARRMRRLIDDLLSLSRVEMHVHLPPTGVVDVNEVARYVSETLAPLAESGRQTISFCPLPGPALILGDREEIVQVIQNLAHNAIKYGREGGRIAIAVERRTTTGRKPQITLSVTDDGPGIAERHLPRLTERFYRVNVASSRDKGGTGLGLAIVKHIVVRHGAELKIRSAVGKGSVFTVVFDAGSTADAAGGGVRTENVIS